MRARYVAGPRGRVRDWRCGRAGAMRGGMLVAPRAPRSRAHAADPSEDPLSTTRGVNPQGMRDSTQGSASISSSTGRITSGILGPYTPTDVTETPQRLRIA